MVRANAQIASDRFDFIDSLHPQTVLTDGRRIRHGTRRQLTGDRANAITFLQRTCDLVKAKADEQPDRAAIFEKRWSAAHALAQQIYNFEIAVPDVIADHLAKHGNDPKSAPIFPGFIDSEADAAYATGYKQGQDEALAQVVGEQQTDTLRAMQATLKSGKPVRNLDATKRARWINAITVELDRRTSGTPTPALSTSASPSRYTANRLPLSCESIADWTDEQVMNVMFRPGDARQSAAHQEWERRIGQPFPLSTAKTTTGVITDPDVISAAPAQPLSNEAATKQAEAEYAKLSPELRNGWPKKEIFVSYRRKVLMGRA